MSLFLLYRKNWSKYCDNTVCDNVARNRVFVFPNTLLNAIFGCIFCPFLALASVYACVTIVFGNYHKYITVKFMFHGRCTNLQCIISLYIKFKVISFYASARKHYVYTETTLTPFFIKVSCRYSAGKIRKAESWNDIHTERDKASQDNCRLQH